MSRSGGAEERPVYWVARGIPIDVKGARVINHPVQPATFDDVEAARASLHAWKQVYPDVKIVEERPM